MNAKILGYIALATISMYTGACATLTPLQAQVQISKNPALTQEERVDAINLLSATTEPTSTEALVEIAGNIGAPMRERLIALNAVKVRLEPIVLVTMTKVALHPNFTQVERLIATNYLTVLEFDQVKGAVIEIATCGQNSFAQKGCAQFSVEQRAVAQEMIGRVINEETTTILSKIAQNTNLSQAERKVAQSLLAKRLSHKAP